jgi:hypothetical protein
MHSRKREKERAMQLVLGIRSRLGLGLAAAAESAPAERWPVGERGRRVLRAAAWLAAFALLATLGALRGASVAIGAEGVSELANGLPESRRSGAQEPTAPSDLRGTFWRPAGSDAQRPRSEIRPRRWDPARQ